MPVTAVVPMLIESPMHIDFAGPTFAAGAGLTVMITESDFEQPVAVTVSFK